MTLVLPPIGPLPADHSRGERPPLSRRMVRELARIYISASTFTAALEVLDRLGPIEPSDRDEEAKLLRAEALIGLGRLRDAERLLGAPMLPEVLEDSADGPVSLGTVLPRPVPGRKTRTPNRNERLILWRFLLQLRILHRMGRYRHVLGLGRAFFLSRRLTPSVLLARISTVVAQSMMAMRRPAEARALYEEILDLYVDLRSLEGQADTLLGMANSHLLDCHWDQADALYQEARYRYEEMGQSDKALACLINLGVLRGKRGDLPGGQALLLQALQRCAQLGEEKRVDSVRLGLAAIETRKGEFRSARRRLLCVLRSARRTGARRNRGLALEYLGALYLHQGRLHRARVVLQAGYRVAHEMSPDGDICFEIRRLQAEVALAERSHAEARVLAAESQQYAHQFGDEYEAAVADRVLAEVEAAEGALESATQRAQAAHRTLSRLGETYERARLGLLLLRLELLTSGLSAGRIHERLEETCRPFQEMPAAPVVREAHRVLAGVGWNVSAVARTLGISRAKLRRSLSVPAWLSPAPGN